MKTEEPVDVTELASDRNAGTNPAPPSHVTSSWCQRSVFRDAVFPLSVLRLQGPSLIGMFIFMTSAPRGEATLFPGMQEMIFFFSTLSHVFPPTNCGETQANDMAE